MRMVRFFACFFLMAGLLGLVPAGCGKSGGGSTVSSPRNLVIIVSDALRRDMLGCYGGEVPTPNIDRLAAEGSVLDNAYSTAPCTMPSSVAMLTGCYARTFTFDDRIVRPRGKKREKKSYFFRVGGGATLMAESLKSAGYATRAVAENGLVKQCNLLQGYREFTDRDTPAPETLERLHRRLGFQVRKPEYRKLAAMLDFLLAMPREQAFSSFIWFYDPHGPYDPPPVFQKRFAPVPPDLPRPVSFYTTAKQRRLREMMQAGELSPAEVKFLRGLYKAEVASVDERVGYVLEALKQSGRLQETLVVFTSDHGESLGEHRRFGHARAIFQELVRVPLIFHGPGIPRGRRLEPIVSHLDLTPTLRELMGLSALEKVQGVSYAGLFRGQKVDRRFLYFDWFSNALSQQWIGTDGAMDFPLKLIVRRGGKGYEFTLYDVSRDPREEVNRAADLERESRRLFAAMQGLQRRNLQLLRFHLGQLEGRVDPAKEMRRATEKLKSLGYL